MSFDPLRTFVSVAGVAIVCASPLLPQTTDAVVGDSDGQQLVLKADGSINYFQSFGSSMENRIEYRTRPRPTIDLFAHLPASERRVNLIDYDADGRTDFIHIELLKADGSTDMVGLYRGPLQKVHEEGHIDHALHHRFILGDSATAKQLHERLDAIRARVIAPDEVGVFSGYGLFAELRLPIIRTAFAAADELASAIRSLTQRPLNQLIRLPDVAAEHTEAIRLILSINPHNLASEGGTAPSATHQIE